MLGILALSATSALAQPLGIDAGITGLVGLPRGDFYDNVGSLGGGGTLWVGFVPPDSPLTFGFELGALMYGREKATRPADGGEYDEEVVNTNNVGLAHLFLRFQPSSGVVRPYVEGLLGIHYLFTHTFTNQSEDVWALTSLDIHDLALSLGPGAGAMIWLWTGELESGRPYDISLDLRLRYLLGSEADYLARGAIYQSDGRIKYDVSGSRTNLATLQIGFVLSF